MAKKELVVVTEEDVGSIEEVLGSMDGVLISGVVPEENPERPEPTAVVNPLVEVTLNLGQAEFVGQHIIFIGGKSVVFHDGVANVRPEQVELLKNYGYVK